MDILSTRHIKRQGLARGFYWYHKTLTKLLTIMRHSAIRVLTKEAESFPWFMVGDACTCSIAVCTVVFKPCRVFISTTTR